MKEIDIWNWYDGEFRVHCPTREIYKQLIRWKFSRHGSTYMLEGAGEYDVTIPEEYVERARRLLTQHFESLTQKTDTEPVLKDNDLQGQRSPVRIENQTESNISLGNDFSRPVEKSNK